MRRHRREVRARQKSTYAKVMAADASALLQVSLRRGRGRRLCGNMSRESSAGQADQEGACDASWQEGRAVA